VASDMTALIFMLEYFCTSYAVGLYKPVKYKIQ